MEMTSKSLEIVNAHIELFEKCRKAYIKASDIETANEYKKDIETFKTIKQDLELLEEIKNLRTTPNALETSLAKYMNKCIELENEYNNLQKEYDELDLKNIDLEKENQEVKNVNDWLKEDISQLKEQLEHNSKTILTQHNLIVKYKNAIQILKDKTNIGVDISRVDNQLFVWSDYAGNYITQQEYDLLKEVIENE